MKHEMITSEKMRAYIDGGLSAHESEAIRVHLPDCAPCRGRCEQLRETAAMAQSCLVPGPNIDMTIDMTEDTAAQTAIAWANFNKRLGEHDMSRDVKQRHSFVWALSGAALTVVIAVSFTVAPVRAWAQQLLSLFRAQHIAVLDLDPASLPKDPGTPQLNQAIATAFSDQVIVTEKPQPPVVVADAAAASKLAGFPVRLLSSGPARKINVESGTAAQMKLDRDRLQAILDEAGRPDLQIPASVDGAVIAVRIPTGIGAQYGDCSQQEREAAAATGSAPESCTRLMELPSPVVSAPAGIDPAQLAEVMLQFIGMKPEEARAFTQTVDWTSTLVLPMMRGDSTYKKVIINGNEGLVVRSSRPRQQGDFSLIWVDEGILYAISGTGDDNHALYLASQLQ